MKPDQEYFKSSAKTCSELQPVNYIFSDPEISYSYARFKKNLKLSFFDEMIYTTLFQMLWRPDTVTPQSELEILYFYKGQWQYYKFNDPFYEENLYFGLKKLIQKFRPKKKLRHYLSKIKNLGPNQIIITEQLRESLKNQLNVNPRALPKASLLNRFFITYELLNVGETFPPLPLPQPSQKTLKPNFIDSLIPQELPDTFCNFNLNDYSDSQFKGKTYPQRPLSQHAVFNRKGDFFIAIIHPYKNLFGYQRPLQVPSRTGVCLLKKDQRTLAFISNYSTDNPQTLYHLLTLPQDLYQGRQKIIELIQSPRFHIYKNPDRLFYESFRGDSQLTESLLALDFPLYHVKTIGGLWAYFSDQTDPLPEVILDSRTPHHLSCYPEIKTETP